MKMLIKIYLIGNYFFLPSSIDLKDLFYNIIFCFSLVLKNAVLQNLPRLTETENWVRSGGLAPLLKKPKTHGAEINKTK